MTTTTASHKAQLDYIAHELKELTYQLQQGERLNAATAAVTIQQELHLLLLALDPHHDAMPRITTSNGIYQYWPIGSANKLAESHSA